MMIAIPNMDKPKRCDDCPFQTIDGDFERNQWLTIVSCLIKDDEADDCPLIEIIPCKECKYSKIYTLQSDAPMSRWCHKGHFPKEVTDGYYCGDGKRPNADQHTQRVESVGERRDE